MTDREKVINDLNVAKLMLCNPQVLTPEMCVKIGQAISSAIALLKEQKVQIKELEEKLRLLEYCDQDIKEIISVYNYLQGRASRTHLQ